MEIEKIEKLKESNPWWKNVGEINRDINIENIEKQKIKWNYKIIEKFEEGIYSLRGPRQVGKTTWIKQKIKELLKTTKPNNVMFFSCDTLKDSDELMSLIDFFLEYSGTEFKYIFLDEIPFVKDWQIGIKHLYDSGKLRKCFILLSGSHSIDIKKSIEQLPGRGDSGKRHYTMLPLTFNEYLTAIGKNFELTGNLKKDIIKLKMDFKEINNEFMNYFMTGGFLRIINELNSKKTISDSSYDVYIKWIIGDLAKLGLKENYSKQILRKVIESYTSEMSWSSFKSGTDIDSHHTILKYIESMEEMFALNYIYKMDFSKKTPDFPKSKKVYFSDPFIFSCVIKWINSNEGNFNIFNNFLEKNKDKISEGVLLNHLINILYREIKSNIYDYKDKIYYWTNKEKTKEIDFIIKKTAIELKYRESIKSDFYKGLNEFKNGFMVTKNHFDKRTYPLPIFLLLLEKYKGFLE